MAEILPSDGHVRESSMLPALRRLEAVVNLRLPMTDVDLPSAGEAKALLAGQDPTVDLVVDMGGVRFCDSTGIGVLIEGLNRHRAAGSRFSVTNLQPQVRHVFDVLGVLPILESGAAR
jgi:anti-anti-sigma factor